MLCGSQPDLRNEIGVAVAVHGDVLALSCCGSGKFAAPSNTRRDGLQIAKRNAPRYVVAYRSIERIGEVNEYGDRSPKYSNRPAHP